MALADQLKRIKSKYFTRKDYTVYKPNKNGIVVLPNDKKIKVETDIKVAEPGILSLAIVHDVIEKDDKFFCRRWTKHGYEIDSFPIVFEDESEISNNSFSDDDINYF